MPYSTEGIESKLFSEKFILRDNLSSSRSALIAQRKKLVLTNGCFDLLHAGHVFFLKQARSCADALWVGINSDSSVRALKGSARPIYGEFERIYLLNSLSCVDGIFLFSGLNLAEEIKLIRPDIYVKAGDYSFDTLNALERQELVSCSADIKFLPFLDGYSTTSTLKSVNCGT